MINAPAQTGTIIELGTFSEGSRRITPGGKIFLRQGGSFYGVRDAQKFPIVSNFPFVRARDHWVPDDFGRLFIRSNGLPETGPSQNVHTRTWFVITMDGHQEILGAQMKSSLSVDNQGRVFVMSDDNELFRIVIGGERYSFGFHPGMDWQIDGEGRVYFRTRDRFYRLAENGSPWLFAIHPARDWYIDARGRLHFSAGKSLYRIDHEDMRIRPREVFWKFKVRHRVLPFLRDTRYGFRTNAETEPFDGWRVDPYCRVFVRRGSCFYHVSEEGEVFVGTHPCSDWQACSNGLLLYFHKRYYLLVVG